MPIFAKKKFACCLTGCKAMITTNQGVALYKRPVPFCHVRTKSENPLFLCFYLRLLA